MKNKMNNSNTRINRRILTYILCLSLIASVFGIQAYASQDVGLSSEAEYEEKGGTDLSSSVLVSDFIIKDSKGEANTQENPLEYLESASIQLFFSIEMVEGKTIQAGDTFSIPFVAPSIMEYLTSSKLDLYDPGTGEKIGEWWVDGDTHTIQGQFNETANGVFKIENGSLTVENLKSVVLIDGAQDVSIGKCIKAAYFEGSILSEPDYILWKYFTGASDNTATWDLAVNYQSIKDLGRSGGTKAEEQTDMILEDKLEADAAFDSLKIISFVPEPLGTETYLSGSSIHSWDLTEKFTQVFQEEKETYEAFRQRLTALQYGVYTDADGQQTVIVDFGDLPGNGLSWKSLAKDGGYDNPMDWLKAYRPSLTEEEATVLNKTIFNNSYDSAILHYMVTLSVNYPNKDAGKKIENTATLKDEARSATGQLSDNSASGLPQRLYARIIKRDSETNERIGGATFKVQILKAGIWEDYAVQDKSNFTTATEGTDLGMVTVGEFGTGTYRFVEIEPAPGYQLPGTTDDENASETFIMKAEDTEGHVVTMTNEKIKTWDLMVSKTVSGEMGNKNADWNFTVKLTESDGTPVSGTYDYETSGTARVTGGREGKVTLDSDGCVGLVMKHGENVVIKGLPADCSYLVTETEADKNGYVTDATGESGSNISTDQKADFLNTRESTVPDSGVKLSNEPAICLLMILLLGVVVCMMAAYRHKTRNKEYK